MPVAADLLLQKKLDPILEIIRRNQFDVIGNLSFVSIKNKVEPLDFRKSGPAIGKSQVSNQLLIVSPWEGVPPHLTTAQKPCPACMNTCDLCQGKKEKICEAQNCGGAGVLETHPLESMRGKKCDVCHGTGKMKCPGCNGTGKRPTGIKGGELWNMYVSPPQQKCPKCHGFGKVNSEAPIDVGEFAVGKLGSFLAIGPVSKFTVRPLQTAGREAPKMFEIVTDPDGDGMLILVENSRGQAFHASPDNPCNAYMVGGIPRQVSR